VNTCVGHREKISKSKKGINPFLGREHPRGMKGKIHIFKGKTYEEIFGDRASIIKSKISNSLKGNTNWSNVDEIIKILHAERARERILKRYEAGWQPKAGRCTKYTYESKIAGKILVDGTWELEVAKWLDSKCLNWKRNTKRFPYTNIEEKISHYTPDFWIEEWDSYLEIKGYETDLDRCKWAQFKENLIVWYKKDIDKIIKDNKLLSSYICI
jgi:hypothetical protein